MGCFLPSVPFCNNTAPNTNPEALTSTSNCWSSCGCASTGLEVTQFLSSSNAFDVVAPRTMACLFVLIY
jgi:hypothetical protein